LSGRGTEGSHQLHTTPSTASLRQKRRPPDRLTTCALGWGCRSGRPAAEHNCHPVLGEQVASLVGKSIPIRSWIDDNRFELPPEQPAFLILIGNQHENRILDPPSARNASVNAEK